MVRARKTPPDGRSNNGGPRQGQPGQAYSNRSDLRTQKIAVPPSAEYGQGERLRRAQQAVPLAAAPPAGVPPPGPPGAAGGGGGFATPDSTPNLLDPTGRPDEPLEHGMPFGPGAGPEALTPAPVNEVTARLRALYLVHPTPELRELIQQAEQGG